MASAASLPAYPAIGASEKFGWKLVQLGRGARQMVRTALAGSLAKRPAHVPPERVVDFDFIRQPGMEHDTYAVWQGLRDGPAIFWTPRNGGNWVLTRAEDIDTVLRDHETYSSKSIGIPRGSSTFRLLPIEADPPEHAIYRGLISPWLTPRAIGALEQDIRGLTIQLVEGLQEHGHSDFVHDFAKRLPIDIFLKLVDLPLGDREKLLRWTEDAVRASSLQQRLAAFWKMTSYLDHWITLRRRQPGADLISQIVTAEIAGRPIAYGEIQGLLIVFMLGGLDTVASMLGFVVRFLAEHPEHRRALVEDPARIPAAVEELLRRFGLVNNARVVTRDHRLGGVELKAGDIVQVPTGMAGLDPDLVAEPMTVNFERPKTAHATFGIGPHYCPGAFLAKMELKIFLEEWLKRIPDFAIAPGDAVRCAPGMVNSFDKLEIVWEPEAAQ